MSEYLCCKCYCEFDDSEGECPLCGFPVCHGDCKECNRKASDRRGLLAEIMCEENPFSQT